MTFDTEIYLKLASAGYLGRQFTVYLDAMGAPGQTNARNYASDYYLSSHRGPAPRSRCSRFAIPICTICWIRWR